MIKKSYKYLVLFLFHALLFFSIFINILNKDWKFISQKVLRGHDESVNSVVAANITRKFFPPMVRVNPLFDEPKSWMEGPYWQHVPPLFTYIPWPLFKLDGFVSIEMKRLAYALVLFFAGILFMGTVYYFERTYVTLLSATLASIIFINTPFTKLLISGIAFGASDMVLALSLVCSFCVILWYLQKPRITRNKYTYLKLIFISILISFPIEVKNLLGAIPPTTFFLLLLYDQGAINLKFILSLISFLSVIFVYFGTFYISSPATFLSEIYVPLAHFGNFEGWARPWYFFITDYIPNLYLGSYSLFFTFSLILGFYLIIKKKIQGKKRKLLILSLLWFIWNLISVSLIQSKAPNFIYQTYIFGLFFSVYSSLLILSKLSIYRIILRKVESLRINYKWKSSLVYLLIIVIAMIFIKEGKDFITNISIVRAEPYQYNYLEEDFYKFGESMQKAGYGTSDIFILNATPFDCFFRYYLLFLTGAEARTFDEVYDNVNISDFKARYKKLSLVIGKFKEIPDAGYTYKIRKFDNYDILEFDTQSLNEGFLKRLKSLILEPLNIKIFNSNQICSWIPLNKNN